MATYTTTIKTDNEYNPVYIRISHKGKPDYIKTDFIIHKSCIRNGKIMDSLILANCALLIKSYYDKLGDRKISHWTVQELKKFLLSKQGDISFTEFANERIKQLKNEGKRQGDNYNLAVKNLYAYLGKDEVLFNELTSKVIQGWIDTMKDSRRKKSLYPACIKAIINAAIREYNDYDLDDIRIKVNPFARVKIPKERVAEKRCIEVEVLNKLFTTNKITFPDNYDGISRKEIGIDVAKMIFCLAGINAADLYDMKKSSLKNGKLCYNRKKTREKSDTGAYTEISIPKIIQPLVKKYNGKKDNLFIFSERFVDAQGFVKNVNKGLKAICEELEFIEDEEGSLKKKRKKPILDNPITTYTFRHSWATIAQNDCKASTEMVAFALNHSSAHKITETYIRKDYSPIDELNEKVIKTVFEYKKRPKTKKG